MSPVPGIVGSIIGIEHIVTGILKIFGCLFGFFHISSDFYIVFSRHRTFTESLHLRFYRITKRYRIVFSTCFLDCFYNFYCKTITIFKASAIFVSTFVKEFNRKLIEQISFMHRMYFHPINACIFTKFCSFCECFNDFMNLFFCHFRTFNIMSPTGFLRAWTCQLVRSIDYRFDNRSCNLIFM